MLCIEVTCRDGVTLDLRDRLVDRRMPDAFVIVRKYDEYDDFYTKVPLTVYQSDHKAILCMRRAVRESVCVREIIRLHDKGCTI